MGDAARKTTLGDCSGQRLRTASLRYYPRWISQSKSAKPPRWRSAQHKSLLALFVMKPSLSNFKGKKFNRLTAVRFVEMRNHAQYWEFSCDCGGVKVALRRNVVKGMTGSCGCLHHEMMLRRNLVHGHAPRGNQHPLYHVWKCMKSRCQDKSDKDYGGRGISVCSRWQEFKNFFDDMAPTYKPGLWIERINNNGNYEPSNCTWATRKEQLNNKRSNHLLTFKGETMPISMWAPRVGGNKDLLYIRLRRGWSVERALSTPAGKLGSNGTVTILR